VIRTGQCALFGLSDECRQQDSWEYDPMIDAWTTLPDSPLPGPAKTNGDAAFLDRYIVLVGGAATL
jgi:hypothetical protein